MIDDSPAARTAPDILAEANRLFAALWSQVERSSPDDAIPAACILLAALIAIAAEDLDDAGKIVIENSKAIMQTIVNSWDAGRELREAATLQAALMALGVTVSDDGSIVAAERFSAGDIEG